MSSGSISLPIFLANMRTDLHRFFIEIANLYKSAPPTPRVTLMKSEKDLDDDGQR